jgi:hypothetical protein
MTPRNSTRAGSSLRTTAREFGLRLGSWFLFDFPAGLWWIGMKPRRLRIESEGAIDHVMARRNRMQPIVRDGSDR